MTRTFPGPDCDPGDGPPAPLDAPRSTLAERAVVLGGFAVAALYTAVSAALGFGMETVGAIWLGAILWTIPASPACALRRGTRRCDWSAFRRHELPDGRDERIDAATQSGQYAFIEVAEEHERLMHGN
ncbi:MAG: hypothetical protein OXN81_04990 [Alphaproteobacteria bacterium]|nr:hypothetical protein [Alphaproteobacteria bacterium]